jgi:hypothetical protein
MPKFLTHLLIAAVGGGALALFLFEQLVVRQRRELRIGDITVPVETARTLYEAKDVHLAIALAAVGAALVGAGLAEFSGRRRRR